MLWHYCHLLVLFVIIHHDILSDSPAHVRNKKPPPTRTPIAPNVSSPYPPFPLSWVHWRSWTSKSKMAASLRASSLLHHNFKTHSLNPDVCDILHLLIDWWEYYYARMTHSQTVSTRWQDWASPVVAFACWHTSRHNQPSFRDKRRPWVPKKKDQCLRLLQRSVYEAQLRSGWAFHPQLNDVICHTPPPCLSWISSSHHSIFLNPFSLLSIILGLCNDPTPVSQGRRREGSFLKSKPPHPSSPSYLHPPLPFLASFLHINAESEDFQDKDERVNKQSWDTRGLKYRWIWSRSKNHHFISWLKWVIW